MFVNKIVKIVHECAKRWDGVPTNNHGDRYILTWRLPTENDVKKQESTKNDNADENQNQQDGTKTPNGDNQWKEDYDEFEDLKEGDIQRVREELSDMALISAVKTVTELSRA